MRLLTLLASWIRRPQHAAIDSAANHARGDTLTTAILKPDWPAKRVGPEEYAPPHRRPPGQTATESMEALVAQAVGASMDEIDRLSAELDKVREVLRNEGGRVGRLVTNYVGLSEATMAAMKIISDRLKAWKDSSHQLE